MIKTKSYVISKFVVLEAYKRVKANKGSSGVDNESMDDFEINLKDNLYKLWNRMSSGSYVPPPVKMVEIDKKDGGKRPLGIPTIHRQNCPNGCQNDFRTGDRTDFSSGFIWVSSREICIWMQ
jgi:hypothetical protein